MAKQKHYPFYRVEINVDGKWIGLCCSAAHIRHLGSNLEDDGLYEPDIYENGVKHSKCWFTNRGYHKCYKHIMETLNEVENEWRIRHASSLNNIVYKDEMQIVQSIDESEDFSMLVDDVDAREKKYPVHLFALVRKDGICDKYNCDDNCEVCRCQKKVEIDISLTKDNIESLCHDDEIWIYIDNSDYHIKLDPSHYSTTTTYEYWEGMKFEHITYKL